MEYLFILDQNTSVDFRVVFLNLLSRLDSRLSEWSHKSHYLEKIEERMIVILHHKAC